MILNYLIDLLCILFLISTALICGSWVLLRQKLPWHGRVWVKRLGFALVVFIGLWHFFFALLKMAWLVTEMWTWGI